MASSSMSCGAATPLPWPRETTSLMALVAAVGRADRDGLGRRLAAGSHPDALLALEVLALGLQRRGDHQLRPVELGDVLVAAGGHRCAQAAHQVERAVVLVRGAEQDLLERGVLHGLHARAARER